MQIPFPIGPSSLEEGEGKEVEEVVVVEEGVTERTERVSKRRRH